MDWTTGPSRFDSRQRQEDFSSNLCVQTGSGYHSASCPVCIGGPFPGGKARPGCDADHSPPPSAEVVNEKDLCMFFPLHLHRCVGGLLSFYNIKKTQDGCMTDL